MHEIDALLTACEARAKSIDLFFTPWFPYAEFLKWWLGAGDTDTTGSITATRTPDAARLHTLLS